MDPGSPTDTLRVPCLPGAPSWVSLLAHDPEAAQAFYGPLLGWSFEPPRTQPPGYVVAEAQGVQVAGIGPLPTHGHFSATWTTFFGVADVDAAVRRVRERLGTVGVGPLGAWAGRIALATDPQGATFGIWQGRPGPVLDLEGPGELAWSELRTSDAFAAAMFYGAVFGWDDPSRFDVRWEHDRVLLRGEDRTLASLFGGGTEAAFDPRVRPRWHVFFAVPDADDAALRAERLGGSVATPAEDTPYGRVIQLRDREGGLFWAVTRSG